MFRFKQFTVFQSECAMKVGTDGVLLGAWADTHNATRILDIGTGTGLLALMLAQRAPHAEITAIEIDPAAVEQAAANAQNSPWGNRIRIIGGDFGKHIFKEKFDLIVSNPPYFCNSLKNPDEKRKTARHDDTLTQETLAKGIAEIIAKNGTACVIYPTAEGESFIRTASSFALHQENRHPSATRVASKKTAVAVLANRGSDHNRRHHHRERRKTPIHRRIHCTNKGFLPEFLTKLAKNESGSNFIQKIEQKSLSLFF